MALSEMTLPSRSDRTDPSLEDSADESRSHAMLFHFDPRTKNIVSYRFTIDPVLTRPGVPDWVTHYPFFPENVRESLEGLYAMAIRSGMYLDR
jgi:hypothetical protein